MKIFNQIIKKSLDLSDECFINKNYKRGIWYFYKAYNLSLAITNYKDKDLRKKIKIYKRLILSQESFNSKLFKKMQKFMRNDLNVILRAMRLIDKAKEEEDTYDYGMYKKGSLGILAYEFVEGG